MKITEKQYGQFIDRKTISNTDGIDVLLPTLDEETFLERCLYSLYREVPVRKLIVCDGGSKDQTIEILKKFPRTEIHIRKDIRTFAKVVEFLFSKLESTWFVIMDAHNELPEGWYGEMCKHKENFDVIENNRRIRAHHFYRENLEKLDYFTRPLEWCHLIKTESVKTYSCDDDFLWRETDIFFRQKIEEAGFRYGKIDTITHLHHETEKTLYESDDEKNFLQSKYRDPEFIILDEKKYQKFKIENAKGIAKYLDPKNQIVIKGRFNDVIKILDRDWIKENAPKWLSYYDSNSSS